MILSYIKPLTGADDVKSGEYTAEVESEAGAVDAGTPAGQAVTTACWLTLKEASLLLGTIAQKVPTVGMCS